MIIYQTQLKLPRNQVLALFNKAMRKLHGQLHKAAAKKIESALPRLKEVFNMILEIKSEKSAIGNELIQNMI